VTFFSSLAITVLSLIVFIYNLIQFMKESSIGTALGLYVSLKSYEDKK
jgi:hypothetical protein